MPRHGSDSVGTVIAAVLIFALLLTSYCAYDADCAKRGGVTMRDGMGFPQCVRGIERIP